MRKEHPQLLTDHLDAKRVDRADDRPVVAVERLQPRADVVPELTGDNPVERDHKDVAAVNTKAGGMQDPLDASDQAEGLSAPRSGDASDGGCVRVYKGRNLRAADPLIPRLAHGQSVMRLVRLRF